MDQPVSKGLLWTSRALGGLVAALLVMSAATKSDSPLRT